MSDGRRSPDLWSLNIGILGGGQLGLMMAQAASVWHLKPVFLDPDPVAPVIPFAPCLEGDFRDFETVLDFGRGKDLVSYEIEQVNFEAICELESRGVRVSPPSRVLGLIRDKSVQKQFFQSLGLPSPEWLALPASGKEVAGFLPAFWKQHTGGYDGRGVKQIEVPSDLEGLPDVPAFLEKKVDIAKELSVVVSRNASGETAVFPVVEMVFHPGANLVDYLISPARISPATEEKCREIALTIADGLNLEGLLAVELFQDSQGRILINEMAPRPHNSGHHSIEGNGVSQYEQFWRAILNLPPGDTALRSPWTAMVNLVGSEGYSGAPVYEGFGACLALPGVHIHLYGKKETRPFRKMGHVSVLAASLPELEQKVSFVKNNLRVRA